MVTATTGRSAIIEAAAQFEPRVQRLLVQASRRIEERIGTAELTRIVNRRDWRAFERVIDDVYGETETALRDYLRRAAAAGANVAIRDIPTTAFGVGMRFDAVNPFATSYAARRSALLVKNITATTRTNLQQLFREAFLEGIPPDRLAKTVGAHVGLLPKQAKALDTRFRNAFKRLEKQFEDGLLTEKQYNREWDRLQRAVIRQGEVMQRSRGLTIARTELMRAANAGQQELWDEAVRNGLIDPRLTVKIWSAAYTATDVCADLSGNSIPFDSAWPYGEPPIHPNCRCSTYIEVR